MNEPNNLQPFHQEQVKDIAIDYFKNKPALTQKILAGLYANSQAKLQILERETLYLKRLLTYFVATGEIPDNPTLVMAYSVDTAINEEIAKRLLKAEEREELIERLSRLAFNMTEAGEESTNMAQAAGWLFHLREKQFPSYAKKLSNLIYSIEPEATATEHEQAKANLKQAEDCGFIAIQGDEVKFADQWLREFFCAMFLQKQELNKELLNRLVILPFEEFWLMWAELDNTLVDRLLNWLHASANQEQNIIVALGKIGDDRAVEPLILALKVDDPDVGFYAAEALGKLGNPRALPELERLALEDKPRDWFWTKIIATSAITQIKVRQTKTLPPVLSPLPPGEG